MNKFYEMDLAAKNNLPRFSYSLRRYYEYKKELMKDPNNSYNDILQTLTGFIWDESEQYTTY